MNINNPGGCTPWDKKYWDESMRTTSIDHFLISQSENKKCSHYKFEKRIYMDPALQNWLNSCTLCNFYIHEEENSYLCDRSFYQGVVKPPCNNPNFLATPKNSADELCKTRFS